MSDEAEIKSILNEILNLIEIEGLKELEEKKQYTSADYLKQNLDDSLLEIDDYFHNIQDLDNDLLDSKFTITQKCDACKTKSSLFWRRVAREKIVCNSCFFEKAYLILFDDEHLNKKIKISQSESNVSLKQKSKQNQNKSQNGSKQTQSQSQNKNRPLTRTAISLKSQFSNSSNSTNQSDEFQTNSCNRRTKFFKKKNSIPKKEVLINKINTSDYVFHKGFYIQIGDIVALRDEHDSSNIYFAQIRAILSDQFGQKSAVLTWLIPVDDNYKKIKNLKDFDPSWFELGPAEEFPRLLDCMEFVTRLKDNQFRSNLSYFNLENQYKLDLLKHKFELEDLAKSNFKLIVNKFYTNLTKQQETQFEIKFD